MPKLTGPLFSISAHGTMKDTITYQGSPSGPRVQLVPKHRDMFTGSQSLVRTSFLQAASQWRALDGATKTWWNTRAEGQGMTGYNLYIKVYLTGSGGTPPTPHAPLWSDDFNRDNGPLGDDWTDIEGPTWSDIAILNNVAYVNSSTYTTHGSHYNGSTYSDVMVKVDGKILQASDAGDYVGLHLRVANPGEAWVTTGYIVYVRWSGLLRGWNVTDGLTELANLGAINWSVYHELKVELDGFAFAVYWDDVLKATYSPVTQTWASGYMGMMGAAQDLIPAHIFGWDDFEIWSL